MASHYRGLWLGTLISKIGGIFLVSQALTIQVILFLRNKKKKQVMGTGKIVHLAKVLAAKFDLSLIAGTHIVEGEKELLQAIF